MTTDITPFISKIHELVPDRSFSNDSVAAILQRLDWGKSGILRAHKFRFAFAIAPSTEVFLGFGNDLLKNGNLRLPFDEVIFEYESISGDFYDRHVILCRQVSPKFCGFTVNDIDKTRDILISLFCLHHHRNQNRWVGTNEHPFVLSTDPNVLMYRVRGDIKENDKLEIVAAHMLIITLGILASSVFTEKEVIIPQELQQARARSGMAPLYNFKIIDLKINNEVRKPSIGNHASPVLHWRRGHYRRVSNKIVPVSACLVGDIKNGILDKEYDARAIL